MIAAFACLSRWSPFRNRRTALLLPRLAPALLLLALVATPAWGADIEGFFRGLNRAVARPPLGNDLSVTGNDSADLAPTVTIVHPDNVPAVACRLPAEFEPQRALLLACHELVEILPDVFADVVRESWGHVAILALVSDAAEYHATMQLLQHRQLPHDHVRFLTLSHDTMWARDYGPMVVQLRGGKPMMIDASYDFSRPNDDRVPEELARCLKVDTLQLPLRLDGGNLLCNGKGLALTTCRLLDENSHLDNLDPDRLCHMLRRIYGLRQVVMLEPLDGESTGHIDMFATFTSADTVIVGAYDPSIDPVNAAILDRNAERLSMIRTARGQLNVVRMPMPTHDDGIWRTYTNVVYANGVLLVPTYPGVDARGRQVALKIFEEQLPGWRIVGVDASRVIMSAGALHCLVMNLGPIETPPQLSPPSWQWPGGEVQRTDFEVLRAR